uniref:Uncharacterized protein n=1 Tax=Steinernema glaseri TaxID=37863 RepID=A0A1I7ZLM6_9BILA
MGMFTLYMPQHPEERRASVHIDLASFPSGHQNSRWSLPASTLRPAVNLSERSLFLRSEKTASRDDDDDEYYRASQKRSG